MSLSKEFLWDIRSRALAQATKEQQGTWQRAFIRLADAADSLDAMMSREKEDS